MSLTLQYPKAAPIVTLELPSPQFGDGIKYDKNLIANKSRNGELQTVLDADWPTVKIYSYEFIGLTDDQADEFRSFLINFPGKNISIVDHLGNTVNGFIIDSESEIVVLHNTCNYNISITFMEEPT